MNQINNPTNTLLTVKDISSMLQISKSKAYQLMKQQEFPVVLVRTTHKIPPVPFNNWLNKNK